MTSDGEHRQEHGKDPGDYKLEHPENIGGRRRWRKPDRGKFFTAVSYLEKGCCMKNESLI